MPQNVFSKNEKLTKKKMKDEGRENCKIIEKRGKQVVVLI